MHSLSILSPFVCLVLHLYHGSRGLHDRQDSFWTRRSESIDYIRCLRDMKSLDTSGPMGFERSVEKRKTVASVIVAGGGVVYTCSRPVLCARD